MKKPKRAMTLQTIRQSWWCAWLFGQPANSCRFSKSDMYLDPVIMTNQPRIDLWTSVKAVSLSLMLCGAAGAADQPAMVPANASTTSANTVDVQELFAPRLALPVALESVSNGAVKRVEKGWHLTGTSPMRVSFVPQGKDVIDLSAFRLAGIVIRNQANGVTTINGRLDNSKPTSWSRHAVGFLVAPAQHQATLGFIFPVSEDRCRGPDIFAHQLAKPTGHRLHWRQFYPEDVRTLTLDITVAGGRVDLVMEDPIAAWPADPDLDRQLETLPFLDNMGQVRAVTWPGKATSLTDAKDGLTRELRAASTSSQPPVGRYGGWLDGPRHHASGRFRTEKIDGTWWLIDPDGYRFFSVGVCLAGHSSETRLDSERLSRGFFEYVPQGGDPFYQASRRWPGGREVLNFAGLNYARLLGDQWDATDRNGIHQRLRVWGLNSLGSWADQALQRDRRTPYTLMSSPWWRTGDQAKSAFPEPFAPTFTDEVVTSLQPHRWAKDDPFCLGVFLGNELDWPDRFTAMVFELPADSTTKTWVLHHLQRHYATIADLNAAWQTTHRAWTDVLAHLPEDKIPPVAWQDIEPLYLDFATAFFKQCKAAVEQVLPATLYLGCRTHRGPGLLGKAALGHVDVFSMNVYEPEVRTNQVPPEIDLPLLIGEFHFGAVDRGVSSPGLAGVWDQRQRGLAFCRYLASALADRRFVGVHWFQWMDQSAAGRFDRENHQCGFVDITGRSYADFVAPISRATRAMYTARQAGNPSTVDILELLIR